MADDETTDTSDATDATEVTDTDATDAPKERRAGVTVPAWALAVVAALACGGIGYAIGNESNDSRNLIDPIAEVRSAPGDSGTEGDGGACPRPPGGRDGGQLPPGGPSGLPGGPPGPAFGRGGPDQDQDQNQDQNQDQDQDQDDESESSI